MRRCDLLLVVLVGCSSEFVEVEEGRYSAADPPDATLDGGYREPLLDAGTDADTGTDTGPDVDGATVDAGTCVRDESRDHECTTYDGADAAPRYAIACPADDAGNPVLPPPAIGCNYTGWADAGSLTMCCK